MARIIIALLFLVFSNTSATFSSQGMDAEAQTRLQQLYRAQNSEDAKRNRAFSRAARRKSKTLQKLPSIPANSTSYLHIEPTAQELEELLSENFSLQTLEQALAFSERLNRPHQQLDEYIALCYWETGNTSLAKEWSQAYLARNESTNLHKHLMLDAIRQDNSQLALFHLSKSELSLQERWAIWLKLKLDISQTTLYIMISIIGLLSIFVSATFFYKRKRQPDQPSDLARLKNTLREPPITSAPAEKSAVDSPADPANTGFSKLKSTNSLININVSNDNDSKDGSRAEQESNDRLPMLSKELISAYNKSMVVNTSLINDLLLCLTNHQTRVAGFISPDPNIATGQFIGNIAVMLANTDYKTLVIEVSNKAPQLQTILNLVPLQKNCLTGSNFNSLPHSVIGSAGLNILQAKATEFAAEIKDTGATALLSLARRNYDITLIVFTEPNSFELIKATSNDTENLLDLIVLQAQNSPNQIFEEFFSNAHPFRIIGGLKCYTE